MRLCYLLFICCLSASASAQFGITANANFHDVHYSLLANDAEEPIELGTGIEIAGHYWFRLPTKRIEFQPTVYYTATGTGTPGSDFDELGFQFKTNIYLFDLGTDCDCPTFGKQGPSLQKGFFLQLAPGYAFYDFDADLVKDNPQRGFTATAAVGIDFGLSNLLTITPIAGFRYGFNKFTSFELLGDGGESIGLVDASLTTYQIGLQATFRLDKRRY